MRQIQHTDYRIFGCDDESGASGTGACGDRQDPRLYRGIYCGSLQAVWTGYVGIKVYTAPLILIQSCCRSENIGLSL